MLRLLLALGAIVWFAESATPRAHTAPYTIADIRAHLYYQESGTFDTTNITSEASPTLWNTIIGEGGAKSPSGATLVLVRVDGSWLSGAHPPRLRVTVRGDSGGPVLLQQTATLSALFTERPSVWVPFIAFGTGCRVVRVSPALLDARGGTQSTLERSIPFECGE